MLMLMLIFFALSFLLVRVSPPFLTPAPVHERGLALVGAIDPFENASVAEHVACLDGGWGLDGLKTDGAGGRRVGRWGGDGEDLEVGD